MLISMWLYTFVTIIAIVNLAWAFSELCSTDKESNDRAIWLVWFTVNAGVVWKLIAGLFQ
jgi:hypothetical protein